MLEWTICTKCGKVLDNSKTECPTCANKTDKLGIDFLKENVKDLTFLVKTLDMDMVRQNCPQIGQQNAGLDIIILDDLFRYFSYLGWGDGVITENELESLSRMIHK